MLRRASPTAPYDDIQPVNERDYALRYVEVLGERLLGERNTSEVRVCGQFRGAYRAGITVDEALRRSGFTGQFGFYDIAVFSAAEGAFYGLKAPRTRHHPRMRTMALSENLQAGDAVVVLEKLIAL